jgi:CRISPR-associated protein Cas1
VRRLLNTLYVTLDGAYVRKDGLNVVVELEGVEKMRVPVHLLGSVAVFGRVSLSPALMGALAEAGVVCAFFGMNGRFLARVEGPVSGNVLLRREQYRRMDDPAGCVAIARSMVAAKALNQRGVLQAGRLAAGGARPWRGLGGGRAGLGRGGGRPDAGHRPAGGA